MFPGKPINLTVTKITSTSAEISWLDPSNQGAYGLSIFSIKIKSESNLQRKSKTVPNTVKAVNRYEINDLASNTTYEVSVSAGDYYGFGEPISVGFVTANEGERLCSG